jgi:hypothetical protein
VAHRRDPRPGDGAPGLHAAAHGLCTRPYQVLRKNVSTASRRSERRRRNALSSPHSTEQTIDWEIWIEDGTQWVPRKLGSAERCPARRSSSAALRLGLVTTHARPVHAGAAAERAASSSAPRRRQQLALGARRQAVSASPSNRSPWPRCLLRATPSRGAASGRRGGGERAVGQRLQRARQRWWWRRWRRRPAEAAAAEPRRRLGRRRRRAATRWWRWPSGSRRWLGRQAARGGGSARTAPADSGAGRGGAARRPGQHGHGREGQYGSTQHQDAIQAAKSRQQSAEQAGHTPTPRRTYQSSAQEQHRTWDSSATPDGAVLERTARRPRGTAADTTGAEALRRGWGASTTWSSYTPACRQRARGARGRRSSSSIPEAPDGRRAGQPAITRAGLLRGEGAIVVTPAARRGRREPRRLRERLDGRSPARLRGAFYLISSATRWSCRPRA